MSDITCHPQRSASQIPPSMYRIAKQIEPYVKEVASSDRWLELWFVTPTQALDGRRPSEVLEDLELILCLEILINNVKAKSTA